MSQHDDIFRGVPDHIREHDQRLERNRREFEAMRQPQPAPLAPYPVPSTSKPEPRAFQTEAERKRSAEQARKRAAANEAFRQKMADQNFTMLTGLVVAGLAIWADIALKITLPWYGHVLGVALPAIGSIIALRSAPVFTRKARKVADGMLWAIRIAVLLVLVATGIGVIVLVVMMFFK